MGSNSDFPVKFTIYRVSKINIICIIASKINVTPKSVYLPISKLHSILPRAILLALAVANNNISQICYCGQILLQCVAYFFFFFFFLQSATFGCNIYFAGDGTWYI